MTILAGGCREGVLTCILTRSVWSRRFAARRFAGHFGSRAAPMWIRCEPTWKIITSSTVRYAQRPSEYSSEFQHRSEVGLSDGRSMSTQR